MNTDGCTENSTKFSIKGTKDKKKFSYNCTIYL